MNVLNRCFSINNSSKHFQENILAELSPIQKKVALVALAVVVLITVSLAIYAYFVKQKFPSEYNVHLKMLTGKTISFAVKPGTTIGAFKEVLHKSEGIPPEDLRLIFAGKQLEDQYSFKDYHITKDKNIHVVHILKGD